MDFAWADWINVLFRFTHVLAAIMWIGDSLLFTWMELNLIRPTKPPASEDPDLLGELDMLHGGGVYHLEKRKLHPNAIPEKLHWFKWQAYTTWLTGFVLLATLFWSNGSSLLDATRTSTTPAMAVLWSFIGIFGGWLVYDSIWRSPLRRKSWAALGVSFIALGIVAVLFGQIFNGRALFLQIGAMLATCMAANVFIHIMGNQHRFMRSLKHGIDYDPKYGANAKARSLHNHYMTFPALFLMLSAHFPRLYGADWKVAILLTIIPALMSVKLLMNSRYYFRGWLASIFGVVIFAAIIIGIFLHLPPINLFGATAEPMDPAVHAGKVLFQTKTCGACHMEGSAQLAPILQGIYGSQQPLNDGSFVLVDDAYIRQSILDPSSQIVKGYAPAMPSFANILSEEDISHLIAYIRSLTPQADPSPHADH